MFYRGYDVEVVERIIVAVGVVLVCVAGVGLPTLIALHG